MRSFYGKLKISAQLNNINIGGLVGINVGTIAGAYVLEGVVKRTSTVNVIRDGIVVHNGKIYINTDRADIDAPIHEMTHMLLGSIRFKNPDLYFDLIESA